MTIPEAIEKAVGEGYMAPPTWDGYKFSIDGYERPLDSIFLDTSFWLAFGKAMDWRELTAPCDRPVCDICHEWLFQWHRFIDVLAQGRSAEEYFKYVL